MKQELCYVSLDPMNEVVTDPRVHNLPVSLTRTFDLYLERVLHVH
jgi:hypothetical protein